MSLLNTIDILNDVKPLRVSSNICLTTGPVSAIIWWVNQYKVFWSTVDRRGNATKNQNPNKGWPKHSINLGDMIKQRVVLEF